MMMNAASRTLILLGIFEAMVGGLEVSPGEERRSPLWSKVKDAMRPPGDKRGEEAGFLDGKYVFRTPAF